MSGKDARRRFEVLGYEGLSDGFSALNVLGRR